MSFPEAATQTIDVAAKQVNELLGQAWTLPKSDSGARTDPYDKFPDVVPVTIRNAALLLRQAVTAEADATDKLYQLEDLVKKAREDAEAACYQRKAAVHRLKISALQPNGGEE